MTEREQNDNELTLDDLQNGYYIWQYKKGFRFGIDAVLLAGFADIKRNNSVLDLGSGTGIIPLLLASKTESRTIRGIELFSDNAALAQKSIAYNSLEDRVEVTQGDIREIRTLLSEASFDVVVSNPPYMPASHGFIAPDERKAAARHEIRCTIFDVAAAASYVLKSAGKIFMVHRPERLSDLFRAFDRNHLEIKRLRFVHPRSGREPNLVLIEAVKGAQAGLRVEKPLYIYNEDGSYSDETLKFYSA